MNVEYFYNLAKMINEEVFCGEIDKSGKPYVEHSIRVSEHLDSLEEKIVALLHEVLKDNVLTEQDLLDLGFPKNIVYSVVNLTKRIDESYEEYIDRIVCSKDMVAIHVKKADLEEDKDQKRLSYFDEDARKKLLKKYKQGYFKINACLI